MLTFDARVKNSDAAQPRVTNVKTPIRFLWTQGPKDQPVCFEHFCNEGGLSNE